MPKKIIAFTILLISLLASCGVTFGINYEQIFFLIFLLAAILACSLFGDHAKSIEINTSKKSLTSESILILSNEFRKEIDNYYSNLSHTKAQSGERSKYVDLWGERKSYWKNVLGDILFNNIYNEERKNYF